jgi:hypothetical protein
MSFGDRAQKIARGPVGVRLLQTREKVSQICESAFVDFQG